MPEIAIDRGELVALLMIWTFAPVRVPAVVGANVTVSVADWPGARTMPPETPPAVSPAPVTVTPETSMLAFPLFVRVDVSELLLPTAMALKLRLVGFALRSEFAVEPLPDRLITRGDGSAFVFRVMDPLEVAVEVGVKMALKATLPDPPMVVEVERPLMLNPVPAALTCENRIMLLPLFLSVMVCELLVPMTTFPKLTLTGVAVICDTVFAGFPPPPEPPLPDEFAVVYPAQLENPIEAAMTNERTISSGKVPCCWGVNSWCACIDSQFRKPPELLSTGRKTKEGATSRNCPLGQGHLNHCSPPSA